MTTIKPLESPSLDVQTGTPAQQWANETTRAAELSAAGTSSFTAPAVPEPPAHVPGTSSFTQPTPTAVTPGTPGPDFPGAYPATQDRREGLNDPNQVVEKAKEYVPSQEEVSGTLKSATETASSTLQSATESASTTLQSVAETAKQYLPASVASYIPGNNNTRTTAGPYDDFHETSLPSTEITGARPSEHSGGVGALPGTINETGVAKVLDEREEGEKGSTLEGLAAGATQSARATTNNAKETTGSAVRTAQETASNLTSRAQETAGAAAAVVAGTAAEAAYKAKETAGNVVGSAQETATTATASTQPSKSIFNSSLETGTSLPSSETNGLRPGENSSGVGSLPGPVGEAGVAQVPYERAVEGVSMPTSEKAGARAGERVGGVGALPGGADETGVADVPAGDVKSGKEMGYGAAAGGVAAGGVAAVATHDAFERKQSVPRAKPEDMVGGGKADGVNRLETDPLVKGDGIKVPQDAGTKGEGMTKDARDALRGQEKEAEKKFPAPVGLNTTGRVHGLGRDGARLDDKDIGRGGVDRVESAYEHGTNVSSTTFQVPSAPQQSDRTKADGDEPNYHPAALHPIPSPSETASTKAEGRDEHSGRDKEEKHKPSLMEKVRGEAKVLSGKIMRKHEKVEEGEALKKGESRGGIGSAAGTAVHADGKT
ncbi:hypothetical protein GLOTRDRAFT_138431 [Gloeophyllum trabeum ATCC 11539]|uniref:Uncharacterized protein n=1 Tax=Gloeophyllum trabeum (strain ATCC 11539 / FP-39264 / Madison 617) TaxID=670483 RepID=S7RRG6_GLOTA|nr:uncharacterized protein GLOTRDRAFT_138431 [Gloeophyllum trabeum ATCC 11539]EPQ55529.1 hypothetical protein GLOTRDRAFT_138431 [Gloeophyllum trabeum ATCC 11539]